MVAVYVTCRADPVASGAAAAAAPAVPSAAVSAAAVPGLALVLDRAHVQGRVHGLEGRLGLRQAAVLADVEADVSAHQAHVAVVDEHDLVLGDLSNLVVPQGQEDRSSLVPDRGLDELSGFAEPGGNLSLFTQPDDLGQDIHLLGLGGQVLDFRHHFVHVLTSADTTALSRKA